jgi:putrescine transport system ATP-binding protein
LRDGARAALSLRPEQIVVARDGEGVPGVVEDIAFRGETTQLRIGVAARQALRVSCTNGNRFSLGEPVRLMIAPDAGVLFAEAE